MNARRPSLILFWAVVSVNAVWWLWLQFVPVHDAPANFWFNAAYAAPFFLSAAVIIGCAWRWRAQRYPETPSLILLATSQALYGAAQLAWTYYNVAEGVELPEFSAADVFYISSVLLRLFAVAGLLVHRLRKHPLPRPAVVALTIAAIAASFAGVWASFAYFRGESDLFTLESFYTLVSFLTIFVAILAVNRDRHGELRGFLSLLLFASISHGLADFLFAIRSRAETYWNGDAADGFYALGAMLLYAAALSLPSRIEHARAAAEERERASAFAVPLAILLVGFLAALRAGDFLYVNGTQQVAEEARAVSEEVAAAVRSQADVTLTAVRALGEHVRAQADAGEEGFVAFASALAMPGSGPRQFSFTDPEGTIRFSVDRTILGRSVRDDPARAPLMERARTTRSLVVSEPMPLYDGSPGAVLLLPVFDDGRFLGAVAGTVAFPQALAAVRDRADGTAFDARLVTGEHEVSSDGEVIYGKDGSVAFAHLQIGDMAPARPFGEEAVREEIALDGATWEVAVAPTPARLQQAYLVGLAGFLSMFLFASMASAIVFLLMTQRMRLREQLSIKTRSLDDSIADLTRKKHYLDNVSDAVVVKESGKVAYANLAAAMLLGAPEGKMGARTRWPYDLLKADPAAVREALARGGAWEGEAQASVDGAARDLAVSVRPFRSGTREEAEIVIARDVSDRKAVERAKTQFVSMVAHQLRAPMTQMRWIVEQLRSTPKLPASAKSALADLDEISTAGGKFIGDILNVSRIERGVLKLETGTIALSALVKQVLEPLLQTAKERGTSFQVGGIPKSASVSVDVDKAVEALRNVADNATKYAPKGTKVEIAVEDDGKKGWVVSVTDKGSGIPKEFWDKVFEIKTEVTPGASSGSAGLGLYLTKKFLDAMGGGVSFKTSSKGTTFFVRFPAA